MKKEKNNQPEASKRIKVLFEAIWDNSSIAIYETDADGKCLSVNKEWCKLAGISKEDALGDGWQEGLHPDDKERIFALWTKHSKTRNPWNFEYRFQTPENVITWVLGTSNPIINEQGEITGYIGVNTDITERKMAEDALKESEEKTRLLIKNSNDIIIIVNEDGEQVFISDVIEDITGYTAEELYGNIRNVIHPEDLELVWHHWNEVLLNTNKSVRVQYRHIHKENGFVWLEAVAQNFLEIPSIKGVVINIRDITKHKQKEEEVAAITDQWQTTFDSVNDAIWLLDKEHRILRSNKKAELLFGKGNLGMKCYQIIHGTDCPIEGCPVQLAFMEKIHKSMEFQIGNNWYNISADPILDVNGNVTSAIHIVRDITGQRKTEDALRKSENHFRSIIENTSAGYFFIDNEGLFQKVNKAWLDLYKYENSEDVIGKHFANVQQIDDLESAREFVEGIKNENQDYLIGDFSRKCKDGSIGYHSFSARPVHVDGHITGIEGFIIDITKQKIAEKELIKAKEKIEESEARFKNMFERHNAIMLLIAPETGLIIDANNSAIKFYGYDKKKLCSMNIDEINTLSKEQVLNERTIALREERNRFIFPHRLANDEIRTVEVHSSPIEFNGQRLLFSIIHDITERKEEEKTLIKSEQQQRELNTFKNKLFSIIAHDLRSPLSNILGFSELLINKIQTCNNDEATKFANIINTSAKNDLQLLDSLLTWGKIQTERIEFIPEYLNLNSVVKEVFLVLNLTASLKNVKLINSLSDDIVVYADQNMLSTILRNLISNAIKFTSSEGIVDINAALKQDHIEISVTDTGVGINVENKKKLFGADINFTTRGTQNEGGSGLGLVLCKEFVEKHQGKIWVEGEAGKGSKFVFTLPISTK